MGRNEGRKSMKNLTLRDRPNDYKIQVGVSVFALLIVVYCQYGLAQFNQAAFLVLNHLSPSIDPHIWSGLTLLGDTSVLWPMLLPFMWRRPRAVFSALLAIPVGGILSVALKHLFNAARPAAFSESLDITIIGPVLTGNSFPSGHTITAFAAACAIILTLEEVPPFQRRVMVGLAWVLAVLVGLSRVMVGAHWPYDIMAGACVGWLGGLSGVVLANKLEKYWQKAITQKMTLFILWLVSVNNLFREFEYPLGQATLWLSCFLSSMGALIYWGLPPKTFKNEGAQPRS
jgi:membrane-associated phospholipid phosphatase